MLIRNNKEIILILKYLDDLIISNKNLIFIFS